MPRRPDLTVVSRRRRDDLLDSSARRPTEAARLRAEKLVDDVKRRKKRIASDFYEMGQALLELSEPAHYEALGYASFDELLQKRRLMSRMQAHKLVEVAGAYPKRLALKLGIEKAYLLTRYTAATPAADLARALATRNVSIDGTPVMDATIADLRAATKRVAGGGSAAVPPALRAAKKKARTIQRELRSRGAKKAVVRAEADGSDAVLVVRLPADQADVLLG